MAKCLKDFIKWIFAHFGYLCPQFATSLLCKQYLGYFPNFKNPRSLNEKMQWLKLNVYQGDPLVTQCADKYAVRDFVKDKGYGEYLIGLLGVWDDAKDIDFDALPDRFVLKCNHGSGTNIVVSDKSKINRDEVVRKLNEWKNQDFGARRIEMSYKEIEKKIICEEFIEMKDKSSLNDYKFFCSYGDPKFLYVATDRGVDDVKFDFFTLDWEWIPVENIHPYKGEGTIAKPENYEKMLEVAAKLSTPFPLVRVDLYNVDGKIYFGELTFLHHGGLGAFIPRDYDYKFGEQISSDIKQGIKNN